MEELRKQLVNIINNTQLPVEAIYYVVKDVFREVDDVYQNILKNAEAVQNAENVEESADKQTAAAMDETEQTQQ